jgi:hypothetical protein
MTGSNRAAGVEIMTVKLHISDLLFGCWHRRLSFPFSVRPGQRGPAASRLTGTYVVCLKCGKEFPYDWDKLALVAETTPDKFIKQGKFRFIH